MATYDVKVHFSHTYTVEHCETEEEAHDYALGVALNDMESFTSVWTTYKEEA